MPDTLFDPTIHLPDAPLEGYAFDNKALVSSLEYLKEHPLPEMTAWLQTHPDFKNWNCAALAAYSGLSEPTLKKLKGGQIADPRGSTFWILFNKFQIRPRDVLKCIPPGVCNIECANQARLQLADANRKLNEYKQLHGADQEELSRLRLRVLEESKAAVAAQAKAESTAFQNEKHDAGIKLRNRLIIALIVFLVGLFVADLLIPNAGWFRFGLFK